MNKKWNLTLERCYPYAIGAIAGTLWFLFGNGQFLNGTELLEGTLSVSGILVGFLSTSKAILLSMNSPMIERLKSSGYMDDLVSYIGQAIWWNLLFCGVCVLGYFTDTQRTEFATGWITLLAVAVATFTRITRIMLKVFKYA